MYDTSAVGHAGALKRILARDRRIVVSGLLLLTLLSWLYLLSLARDMGGMSMETLQPAFAPWSATDWGLTFLMWAVMMVAMMVPSAAPMILLFARVQERGVAPDAGVRRTFAFTGGYLLAWTGFSLAATVLQWLLVRAALISAAMVSSSGWLGAGLLLVAGTYQLLPGKDACLQHCRSPAHFLAGHFRPGVGGAHRMGLEHGPYCIGCCWALMLLLFVGGVMNLLWIALLSAVVLIEKTVPGGLLVARVAGVLMLATAGWLVMLQL